MTMKKLPFLLLLSFLASTVSSRPDTSTPPLIQLLRPRAGSAGRRVEGVSCLSWRFGVETNSIIGWTRIPELCEDYVGHYMLGDQYRKDSAAVTAAAWTYVKSLNHTADGKSAWVFDIDETTLSNLPYYAHHGFGVELYNSTAFNTWVEKGAAPALPESQKLYKKLLGIGIKVVFLTGRPESQRSVTEANLKSQGYTTYEKLILKNGTYATAVEYKSSEREKLVTAGYTILGSMGDQWSDLLGSPTGDRTFKLPDPMYYIS